VRLPFRNPDGGDDPFRDARRRALLRGAGKFAIVVVAAGVGGTALGLGLSKLNGNDSTSTPVGAAAATTTSGPAATETAATATTPATTITTTTAPPLRAAPEQSSGGKLRVDVLSTIVHPSGGADRSARVSVHVRVKNGSSRVVTPQAPVLFVGNTQLQIAPGSAAAEPLLGALGQGAIADGRLNFDTTAAVTGELTTGRVRILVAGKVLTVTPRTGTATSG
jgi:hypothetical protein